MLVITSSFASWLIGHILFMKHIGSYIMSYVHNNIMLAFGTPENQILIGPIFALQIQSAHAMNPDTNI